MVDLLVITVFKVHPCCIIYQYSNPLFYTNVYFDADCVVHICIGACAHECRGQKSTLVLFLGSCFAFSDRVSHWDLGANYGRLTGQQFPGFYLSPPLQ